MCHWQRVPHVRVVFLTTEATLTGDFSATARPPTKPWAWTWSSDPYEPIDPLFPGIFPCERSDGRHGPMIPALNNSRHHTRLFSRYSSGPCGVHVHEQWRAQACIFQPGSIWIRLCLYIFFLFYIYTYVFLLFVLLFSFPFLFLFFPFSCFCSPFFICFMWLFIIIFIFQFDVY